MTAFSFNAKTVEPDQGRIGALPAGWYPVSADETELKPTGNGGGEYINVRFTILDGPYKNSKFWHRFNTKNLSDKAVEIGYKQLSALMHAINVLEIKVLAQLQNVPLFVKVKLVPAEYEPDGVTVKYEAKNEITAFRSITDEAARAGFQGVGAKPAAAKAPPPPTAAVAAPAAGWKPPVAEQPWTPPNTAAAVAAVVQAPVAAAVTAPVTSTVTQTSAPAAAPVVQPSWATAPATVAVAPTTTAVPSQEQPAAQAEAPASTEVPPWMVPPAE
jgi:hypothetical protein